MSHDEVFVSEVKKNLPSDTPALMSEVYTQGVLQADVIRKRHQLITDRYILKFDKECDHLEKEHPALAHLCRAFFRLGLRWYPHDEVDPIFIQKRNRFFLGNAARQELARALLLMNGDDRRTSFSWVEPLGLETNYWYKNLFGALAISRLAFVLKTLGARVFWPTIQESTDHRIHLIATFKGHSDGMCVTIRSSRDEGCVSYHLFDSNGSGPKTKPDEVFVSGVERFFQKRYRGIWLPISVRVSSGNLDPGDLYGTEEFVTITKQMIENVVSDFDIT